MPAAHRAMTRRRWLRAATTTAALAPFLPARLGYGQRKAPRRLVLFVTANGMNRPSFEPTGGESSFQLGATLKALEPFRSRILFLKGLDWKSWLTQVPQPGNDHQPPFGHCLTGMDTVQVGTQWYANGPSVDQVIAQKLAAPTKLESLVLGVKSGGENKLSYRAAKVPIPPENDPQKVFARLFTDFQPGAVAPPRPDPRAVDRRSVLDLVSQELAAVRPRVGADDRGKIDAHLEAVRSIEKRLALTPVAVAGAGCAKPSLAAHQEPDDMVRIGRQQMDLLTMALACDLTRVVVLQWGSSGSGERFPFLGFADAHHSLAHYMGTGTQSEQSAKIVKIETWYAEQFAYLIGQLDRIAEGEGTLLDNSVVVWTSEHGRRGGDHHRENLPYVLAGRAGGALRPGRFLTYPGVPHNNLYVSLCHAMGLTDVTTFGTPRIASGPLSGLT